ncbi:MAG TPA: ABC transporter permease [Terriglobia bacterium]|nr:ABC transporter permease [Terriglobia bacterium]
MRTIIQDLRYGLRAMRRAPVLATVAVLSLGLGIGATTAIFSAANALLLNPYPFPHSERIVSVEARHVSGKNSGAGYRDFLDWRQQNTVFEEMAIEPETIGYTLTGQGEPQRVTGGLTTADFLRVLGIEPVLGRFFTADEDKPDGPRVAVLTYAAWQNRFGGRADVLGRALTLDGRPVTVIGVLPRSFAFPGVDTCEFLAALGESPLQGRYQHQYGVVARLKAGIMVERAQNDMTTIARRLEQEYPATNKGWGITVRPLRASLAEEARTPVIVLFSAVAFVLLLACVNVAGLLLARASGRAKEIAIRASLGAGRARIARQMLTEAVLLSLCGGAAGLLFAGWLMDVLRAAAPRDFALDATLRLNSTVLAFTLAVSLLTGISFGLAPAWYAARTDLNAALKGDGTAGSGALSRGRLMSFLVAGEVALSLILLVGAGLLVKSFVLALRLQTGLRVDGVLTFALDLPEARYASASRVTGFYRDLLDRLRHSPGIESAAAVMTLPMTGGLTGGSFQVEGRPKAPDWVDTMVQYNITTPGYFRTMGIPVLRGRDFDEHDTATSRPVAVVNDRLARQFFPNDDPIGHRYRDDYDGKWRTIVGVVGSTKFQQPVNAPFPGVYSPHAQSPSTFMWITARTSGDPGSLAGTARGAVRNFDRDLPLLKVRTMRQVVADSLSEPRLLMSFLAGFAAFALLLAAIGIYGIVEYSVRQRMHELGVRVALGASARDVLGLVLRRGAILAGVGAAVGIPLALAGSRLMGSLLYGISPRDLTVFAAVPLLLLLVALAACYLPARRAARVDPLIALRSE